MLFQVLHIVQKRSHKLDSFAYKCLSKISSMTKNRYSEFFPRPAGCLRCQLFRAHRHCCLMFLSTWNLSTFGRSPHTDHFRFILACILCGISPRFSSALQDHSGELCRCRISIGSLRT